jgi:hypothetical protein
VVGIQVVSGEAGVSLDNLAGISLETAVPDAANRAIT